MRGKTLSAIPKGMAILAAAALVACSDAAMTRHALAPTTPLLGIRPANPRPPASLVRTAELERLEVCKDYAAGSTAPALTDFTVAVTGGTTQNFGFQLTPGECQEIWVNGAVADLVTVTETVPAGFSVASVLQLITTSGLQAPVGPTPGNSVAVTIGGPGLPGALLVFTNTPLPPPPPPPSAEGRMTGGGVQLFGGARISRGFTIHCDIVLSNNLEINWGDNKWHIDKPLTSAYCFDDPNVDHGPPAAPFDTFVGEGVGRLNGVDGAIVKFTFVDAGEPGKNDQAKIQIFAPGGALVLDIPLSNLDHGNIQAHYDQPHGSKAP